MTNLSAILDALNKMSEMAFVVGGLPRDYIFHLKSQNQRPQKISPSLFKIDFSNFTHFVENQPFCDIDISVNLTPKQVGKMLEEALPLCKRVRNFATNSMELPNAKLDVTSSRIDFECDGKNAKMKLGASIFRDSHRRDFTFNALYLNSRGEIFDFHGGIDAIFSHKIEFIGDAHTRICEDFTRIQRYEKFCERFSMQNVAIDEVIAQIKKSKTHPSIMR